MIQLSFQASHSGSVAERIAMLKYGVDDIRHFYTNDTRFLSQFHRSRSVRRRIKSMLVSLKWLSQYVDISSLEAAELAEKNYTCG